MALEALVVIFQDLVVHDLAVLAAVLQVDRLSSAKWLEVL